MLVTKWKTLSRKALTKTIAFILFILSISIGILAGLDIYLNVEHYESITVKDYMKSKALSEELRYSANRLEYILRVYKSEEFIRSGGTVKYIGINDSWQIANLYNNFLAENNYEDNADTKELFYEEKQDEIQAIKEVLLNSHLTNYEQIIDDLNNPEGLLFYATDGSNICTNVDDFRRIYFSIRKAYVVIDENGVEIKPENGENTYSPALLDKFESIKKGKDDTVIYIGISDEGLALRTEKWNKDRNILLRNISIIVLQILVILVSFIFLIIVAGKKPEDDNIHFIFLDKLYTDINTLIIMALVAVAILGFDNVINIRYFNGYLMNLAMFIAAAFISALFLLLFLSDVKHIKNGTFIKYSLIYIVLSKIFSAVYKIFTSGPLMLKMLAAIILVMAGTYIGTKYPILLVLTFLVTTFVVYNKVTAFNTIKQGLNVAKEGNYDFEINVKSKGEFKELAENINKMTAGLNIAVQNEVKSERLKSELITNVSHDIKTPLTSIISYIDLLKREGLQSPEAPNFLDILERKSHRLKILTEDLFEAAKATSGSMRVDFEKVDVKALVSQIMGELDEKIIESGLKFIINASDEKIYAKADGRLLSRVMENLLSNIFKYALENSRVYIDIVKSDKQISICFKNVSANALNIPAEELMERFKRGDESRSSEGSGLGLAIAKSLMELQKGVLEISIDGDLFKAEIKLPPYEQ